MQSHAIASNWKNIRSSGWSESSISPSNSQSEIVQTKNIPDPVKQVWDAVFLVAHRILSLLPLHSALALHLHGQVQIHRNGLVVERRGTKAEPANRIHDALIQVRIHGLDDLNVLRVTLGIDVHR